MHFKPFFWIPSADKVMGNEEELLKRRSPLFSCCLPFLTLRSKFNKSRAFETIAYQDEFSVATVNPLFHLF
jgi:hypothetical protein